MGTGSESGSRIISIGTAVPEYATAQNDILGFMQDAYNEPLVSRKLNALFHHSGIDTRYSVLPDFSMKNNRELFLQNHEKPHLQERIDVFRNKAMHLASMAIENALENIRTSGNEFNITHLITVTCTGLYAPGLDAELIELLHLPSNIFHTSLNFLGCNAAFPALQIADSIVQTNTDARVLVVCVELCTLHFQPKNNADNLLSNTIFGDGAAAVIMVPEAYASRNLYKGLHVNGFSSKIFSAGKELLGWNLTPVNFEMILDAEVPKFLGKEIESIVDEIFFKFKISAENVRHWAIHPGGKKILDEVQQQLRLFDNELKSSYHVLKMYGNMSSPSILFVLSDILQNGISIDETILSMGFGPGISVESALFTYDIN
jgi:predicted naringenin-chalcone synthase